jgi:hypothetical protein
MAPQTLDMVGAATDLAVITNRLALSDRISAYVGSISIRHFPSFFLAVDPDDR